MVYCFQKQCDIDKTPTEFPATKSKTVQPPYSGNLKRTDMCVSAFISTFSLSLCVLTDIFQVDLLIQYQNISILDSAA